MKRFVFFQIKNSFYLEFFLKVFYYSTAGPNFARKRRQVKHHESPEQFPPRVEAAFSMPNGLIYLFRGNQYCVRKWLYDGFPPFVRIFITI
jgi:hypothetical protein